MQKDDFKLDQYLGRVVVVDSSVVLKMFLREEGKESVKRLFHYARKYRLSIFAPALLKYEFLNTISRKIEGYDAVLEAYDIFSNLKISFVDPSYESVQSILKEVCSDPKITFYDASYSALAKDFDGVFLTADKKYYDAMKKKIGIELFV